MSPDSARVVRAPRVSTYRVAVVGRVWRRGRVYRGRGPAARGAYTAVELAAGAWCAWTLDRTAEPWRLAVSGTSCFAGGVRAVQAARAALRDPRVTQVQIRTNQDRKILVYNRSSDGKVTYYGADE